MFHVKQMKKRTKISKFGKKEGISRKTAVFHVKLFQKRSCFEVKLSKDIAKHQILNIKSLKERNVFKIGQQKTAKKGIIVPAQLTFRLSCTLFYLRLFLLKKRVFFQKIPIFAYSGDFWLIFWLF